MRKRKWLALALAVMMVVGLMGGVVSARNNSPAAPAVANRLLKDAGRRSAGQIMRHVAQAMGQGASFPAYDARGTWDGKTYVQKSDTTTYRNAVAGYLKYLSAGIDSTRTRIPVRPEKPKDPEKPFSPKDIEGLLLWLDASRLNLDDEDLVYTWADLSGQGNHAVATAGREPTYLANQLNGRPVVWFNGGGELVTPIRPSEADFADGVTVFLVANFFDDGFALGSWGDPRLFLGAWEGTDPTEDSGVQSGFGNSWERDADSTRLQEWRILEMVSDGEEVVVYDDGEVVNDYAAIFTGTNQYYLAIGNANGVSRYFEGDMAEVLIYKGALDDQDREDIENYLQDKYFD